MASRLDAGTAQAPRSRYLECVANGRTSLAPHHRRAQRMAPLLGLTKRRKAPYKRLMTIQVGSRLPDATLYETTEFTAACPVAPNPVQVAELCKGQTIVLFGLPGAYTPTCSAQHVPGYVAAHQELREKGVDEIWCVSVNDAFVMAEWGRARQALGKIRFLGDGSAEFTRALGLGVEIPGMGLRLQRCSLLVEDGVVRRLNVEAPRKFEVSDAQTMLSQLG